MSFDEVEGRFARDSGRGDQTPAWWRQNLLRYFAEECQFLSKTPSQGNAADRERLEVLYPYPQQSPATG